MNRFLHLAGRALLAACLSSAPAWAGFTAETQQASNGAKNLARMNCGAQIETITPDGRVIAAATASEQNVGAAALIMDDDTLSYPLQEGSTTLLLKLPRIALLDRFTFVNENAAAAGEIKIFVSNYQLPAQSEKWIAVEGEFAFTRKRLFDVSMLGVEARYVKIAFKANKPGRIAALGLYGGESLEAFSQRNQHVIRSGGGESQYTKASNTTTRRDIEDSLNFDFANLYAKARVVYVSSGAPAAAKRMIDDDTVTAFNFAATDQHPTTIVELAQNERLHRVSALYKMQAGRLDVYLLNELRADRGDLRDAKLIATVTDHRGSGKAAVNFDPQGARYVALRWTPDVTGTPEPFEVAEINAFGDVAISMLNFAALPEIFASADALTTPEVPEITAIPTIPVVSR